MPNQTLHKPFSISTSERHSGNDVIVFWEKRGVLSTAVHFAVEGRMDWKVSLRTRRNYRFPMGIPYLTGYVMIAAMDTEEFYGRGGGALTPPPARR